MRIGKINFWLIKISKNILASFYLITQIKTQLCNEFPDFGKGF
jgi:hypothetical protein